MLIDQTIILKDLFHPTQGGKKREKEKRKRGRRKKRDGKRKENGFEYSKNSCLKLTSYLKGNYNFSRSFIPIFPFFIYFRPLLKQQGTKWGFMTSWSLKWQS